MTISYETTGEGSAPWITLVHGFAHNRRYFASALPALTEHFRVLQLDLRGHGQSSDSPGPFGLAEYTEDVAEVLAQEGIERTDLWASQMGTGIGLALAVEYPELIGQVVLEGAVLPDYPMPRTDWLLGHATEIARTRGVAAAMKDWFESADWFEYEHKYPEETNAEGQRALLAEFGGAPLVSNSAPGPTPEVLGELGSLSQRFLIYNGEYDLPESHEVAAVLAECIPDARRREIDNAGGFPLWENPRAVVRLVTEFLH